MVGSCAWAAAVQGGHNGKSPLTDLAPSESPAKPVRSAVEAMLATYLDEPGLSDEQLLGRADAALYAAKAAGRGIYRIAPAASSAA